MDLNAQKEQFSYGYLKLLCAINGLAMSEPERCLDNIGIDTTITSTEKTFHYLTQLAVQVKCTSQNVEKKEFIHFKLKVSTYNQLRKKCMTQVILIVLIVPDKLEDWLIVEEKQMTVKKCGYWINLQGEPEVKNDDNYTIKIPKENIINSQTLLKLIKEESNKKDELMKMIEGQQ